MKVSTGLCVTAGILVATVTTAVVYGKSTHAKRKYLKKNLPRLADTLSRMTDQEVEDFYLYIVGIVVPHSDEFRTALAAKDQGNEKPLEDLLLKYVPDSLIERISAMDKKYQLLSTIQK